MKGLRVLNSKDHPFLLFERSVKVVFFILSVRGGSHKTPLLELSPFTVQGTIHLFSCNVPKSTVIASLTNPLYFQKVTVLLITERCENWDVLQVVVKAPTLLLGKLINIKALVVKKSCELYLLWSLYIVIVGSIFYLSYSFPIGGKSHS